MTAGSDPTRRGGSGWFLAGYAGIAGFFALEAVSREGGPAASLGTSADDQDTTKMIVAAFAAAVVLAPFGVRAERALDRGLDGILSIGRISADHTRQPDKPAIFVRQDLFEGHRFLTHRRSTP